MSPITWHAGEFVITASDARQNVAELEALNEPKDDA